MPEALIIVDMFGWEGGYGKEKEEEGFRGGCLGGLKGKDDGMTKGVGEEEEDGDGEEEEKDGTGIFLPVVGGLV